MAGEQHATAEILGTGLAVTLPPYWRVWSPPAGNEAVVASDVGTRRSCVFALVEGATSAEGAAQETREMIEAHPDLELVAYAPLDAPAGEAVRVSHRYTTAPEDDRFITHQYHGLGPDGVASIYCSSDDPPTDHWRSIVDSPGETGAKGTPPAPFDPRVQVPDHGFAVDFGAE